MSVCVCARARVCVCVYLYTYSYTYIASARLGVVLELARDGQGRGAVHRPEQTGRAGYRCTG